MIESIFKVAESAVSPSNLAITFVVTLLISLSLGIIIDKIGESGNLRGRIKDSLYKSILEFIIIQLVFIILYFIIRDEVFKYRYSKIEEAMMHLNVSIKTSQNDIIISSWQSGLQAIQHNPQEIGYYIETTNYLEKEKDYKSAVLLIEIGLDYIKQSPIPPSLCNKLRQYYKYLKLKDRPEITDKCETFIEITSIP
jgi:hypothetical protein